jgi:CHAD domain-containing protein
MAPLSKWIDGLDAEGSVSDAARKSLEARLATVAYWLPLAARPVDGDLERVHQLRVASRRAAAAISLYHDWLPDRPRRWIKKRLKKIRRAAGDARDLDVLGESLATQFGAQRDAIVTLIADQRAKLQPKLVEIADRCHRHNRLQQKTYRLLSDITPQDATAAAHNAAFRTWAATQLHKVTDAFFAAEPAGDADWSALHQFRVAGKELRYTLELVTPAFGAQLREVAYPIVEGLQEKLGQVNDFVVGREQLQKERDAATAEPLRAALDTLVAEQEASRDAAIAEFRAWWTPDRAQSLRQALLN